MYCNRPVIGVVVIGLLGLALIFMFDPTHNYPATNTIIELLPGAEALIPVPTTMSGFMQWAGSLIGDPHLWIETNNSGIEVADYMQELVPGVQFGFRVAAGIVQRDILVRNLLNETVNATINCIMAPGPGTLGSAKAWWYIILAFVQILFNGGLAFLRPPSNVITRAAASGSIAASKVQQAGKGIWFRLTHCLRRLCSSKKKASAPPLATDDETPPNHVYV